MKQLKLMSLTAFAVAGLSSIACGDQPGADDEVGFDSSSDALSGTSELKAVHSNKCVDVSKASLANGARIQQWRCAGVDQQRWRLKDVGGGQHELIGVGSGKCIQVKGSSQNNGASIEQWDCSGAPNQLWNLVSKGSGQYQIRSVSSGKCLDVPGSSLDNAIPLQQYTCGSGKNQIFQIAGASDGTGGGKALAPHVMTWYTFQDNTPVNSAISSSGRRLKAYVTVAVPFRELKQFGGSLNYGDKLYLKFLAGRKMPNGKSHSGWVEIADFCGDQGDDSYCYQRVGGKSYPNVDLYIGDILKSGMVSDGQDCSGPAGSGQELTDVSVGDSGAAWTEDYGAASLGSGKCGDEKTAMAQQKCWYYTPPNSTDAYCSDCTAASCAP
jgi:hypothetical protein